MTAGTLDDDLLCGMPTCDERMGCVRAPMPVCVGAPACMEINYDLPNGDSKVSLISRPREPAQWGLLNMGENPVETKNLALDRPEPLSGMLEDYLGYERRSGVIPPMLPRGYV